MLILILYDTVLELDSTRSETFWRHRSRRPDLNRALPSDSPAHIRLQKISIVSYHIDSGTVDLYLVRYGSSWAGLMGGLLQWSRARH